MFTEENHSLSLQWLNFLLGSANGVPVERIGGVAIPGSDVSRGAQTGSCIITHRHLQVGRLTHVDIIKFLHHSTQRTAESGRADVVEQRRIYRVAVKSLWVAHTGVKPFTLSPLDLFFRVSQLNNLLLRASLPMGCGCHLGSARLLRQPCWVYLLQFPPLSLISNSQIPPRVRSPAVFAGAECHFSFMEISVSCEAKI